MANSVGHGTKRDYSLAGLGPGLVLFLLVLQAIVLLILFIGWVGHWNWLRSSFPGGLFAGSFPIIVTWAGAAGGIANAVRGLTSNWPRYVDPLTSRYERRAWNAWSLSQGPLGAAYGSVAVLLLALVLGVVGAGASGTLDLSPTGRLTLTAIAFVVGYHQQVFHDLIKRTVEAIFAPRTRPAGAARARAAADAARQSWGHGAYAEMPAASSAHPWLEQPPPTGALDTWAEQAPASSEADGWPAEAAAVPTNEGWPAEGPAVPTNEVWRAEAPAARTDDGWPAEAPAAWLSEWDATTYAREGLEQPSATRPDDDDHVPDAAAPGGPGLVADPPLVDLAGARPEVDGSTSALGQGEQTDDASAASQPEPVITRRTRTAATRRTTRRQGH